MEMPEIDPAACELAFVWFSRLEGKRLAQPMPPEARTILINRCDVLDSCFADLADIRGNVRSVRSVREMLELYAPALHRPKVGDYVWCLAQHLAAPVWAIVRAVDRVKRGEIPRPEFPPLPGLLRGLAWDVARPFWAEHKRLKLILAAESPAVEETAEKRRQVAARILAELGKAKKIRYLSPVSYSVVLPTSHEASPEDDKPADFLDF
jgi:hypothetical protein